jgi:hypothetical protein
MPGKRGARSPPYFAVPGGQISMKRGRMSMGSACEIPARQAGVKAPQPDRQLTAVGALTPAMPNSDRGR